MKDGFLVISLDLEMRWGVLESYQDFTAYKNNILGVEEAVISILNSFDKYKIHATWATVGALLCDSVEDFKKYSPEKKPQFKNPALSSYTYIDQIGEDVDQFFNYKIIKSIAKYSFQELASHSFSHLFIQDHGVTKKDFDNDLKTFSKIYRDRFDIQVKSFVFPRNQIKYLEVLKKYDYKVFRGNRSEWFYGVNSKIAKLIRFYTLHLGSSVSGTTELLYEEGIINVPGTVFLRPYDNIISSYVRVKRIKRVLKYANDNGRIVHLWWHPHNFGINIDKNINMLNEILEYSNELGLKSVNMMEIDQKFGKNARVFS